ncbi:RNB domain-containing ribonuclease [Agromyces lapidis]|uniref:RNB domain-containing ribonuclease n=1 Tax=Agromyces lapidis TaxID=279574 RepID=A0ABV5SR82_9MICO|nr:RNB domain-containing ribonuclease [Agromyces lapidis]
MPARRPHLTESVAQSELADSLAALRASLDLPEAFPPEALAEAEAASAPAPAADLRELPFATIDPSGSTDLDQAMHLARRGDGYLVHYAIADVPAFVAPGGAVDLAARGRGQTLYAADGRIPLHPPAIGDDRASLLPGVDRPAFVWRFELGADGAIASTRLERALIRSRARLDYPEAQALIEAGDRDAPVALLGEIGRARIEQERLRGGASLNAPDEEIVRRDGGYDLLRRTPLPVEDWNAQLSLMTGMAAAAMMLDARVGVLRTMPAPDGERLAAFRRQTEALGCPWPDELSYGEYLRGLDRSDPLALAVLQVAGGLFRGAGYVAFDGTPPAETEQAALAAPYAHVTAPIRRLVDRWGLVVCEAVAAGREVPDWARDSLAALPPIMAASAQRAAQLDSGSIARVEAALLHGRVGERFTATVLELRGERAVFQLETPAVTASCPAPAGARAGGTIEVVLEAADIKAGTVRFSAV